MDIILPFEIEFLEETVKLFTSTFNDGPWLENWDFEKAAQRIEEIYDIPNSIGLVYFHEQKIVGFIMGVCLKWYKGFQFEIKEFFVEKSMRRKGIGKALLKKLEYYLKEKNKNIYEIYLLTIDNPNTIKFYESNGYKIKKTSIVMNKKMAG